MIVPTGSFLVHRLMSPGKPFRFERTVLNKLKPLFTNVSAVRGDEYLRYIITYPVHVCCCGVGTHTCTHERSCIHRTYVCARVAARTCEYGMLPVIDHNNHVAMVEIFWQQVGNNLMHGCFQAVRIDQNGVTRFSICSHVMLDCILRRPECC